jgi:hypothetical protein
MKTLKEYFRIQKQIYDYFGYVEDWVKIPLQDNTDDYWWYEDGNSQIWYSDKPFTVEMVLEGKELYSDHLYTQRFLPRWVYEGEEYTMICCDPQVDGNKFLRVFPNAKRLINPSSELIAAFDEWSDESLMEKFYTAHPHMRALHQKL